MSTQPALLEPTAVDSEAGGVEVVWEGTAEQGLAMMLAAPLSPGVAELREEWLTWTQAHLQALERTGEPARQPLVRGYFEQVAAEVARVLDAGADDPASYLAALREGRPWRSIGDAGLLAAIERCQRLLTVASRLLVRRCGMGLVLVGLLLAMAALLQPPAEPRPRDLVRLGLGSDRAPPPRRLAFLGLIDRALP